MQIGVTGHRELGDEGAAGWVKASIRRLLEATLDPIGLSSLARGSDQIFAEVVLDLGGRLTAVIPFPGYETRLGLDRDLYGLLLMRATNVIQLEAGSSDEESYYEAGKWIVDHADHMIAVWNGLPSRGLGGTADIVAYAKLRRRQITQINPASRTVMKLSEGQP